MTAKAIVAVIAGVLVAAAATYHFVRTSPATPTEVAEIASELPAPTVIEPAITDMAAQHSNTPKLSAEEVVSDAQSVYVHGVGEVEFELIDGIRVKKDRNCTFKIAKYVTRPDGTASPAVICEPHEPRPVDPYTTYSTEALKTLAYSDAHAAHVLSQRFREKDFPQAFNYALRSSVLDDNTNSIRWLLNTYPTSTYKNDQVQVHVIEDNYVMSGVIYALGGPGEHHLRWLSLAQEHAKDGIDREALDTRIASLMNDVEFIRSEVGIK